MQCYISTLPSTTPLWNSPANYQYISQYSKPLCDEYLISRIQNMATFRETTGTWPSCITWPTYHQFLLINSTSTWSTAMDPSLPFISTDQSIDDTASLWTLFSHTGIYVMPIGSLIPSGLGIFCCYFFLVLTCQISALTFMIRFFMTYYCGWWCRGSIHLQMWWQDSTAYNETSWESWPVYKMGTYTDGESAEATSTVKSSSYIWIIG